MARIKVRIRGAKSNPYGLPFIGRECVACDLHQYRKQFVPGTGPMDAKMVLVGQNPGKDEDEQGVPFVGKAGKILDRALRKASVKRKDVRITNSAHCITPRNRAPSPNELGMCRFWLDKELAEIDPMVVVAIGGVALRSLGLGVSVSEMCGKEIEADFSWGECLIIPCIHPAAILYCDEKEGKRIFTKIVKALKVAVKNAE